MQTRIYLVYNRNTYEHIEMLKKKNFTCNKIFLNYAFGGFDIFIPF